MTLRSSDRPAFLPSRSRQPADRRLSDGRAPIYAIIKCLSSVKWPTTRTCVNVRHLRGTKVLVEQRIFSAVALTYIPVGGLC